MSSHIYMPAQQPPLSAPLASSAGSELPESMVDYLEDLTPSSLRIRFPRTCSSS